ncbi:caspase-3-like [Pantherophis guttatus]|uniref:Caspase-3-like n=1 Tax=Pantherophis guttatus TaxID=94885 RepID=A0A6P9DKU9_PANGU|nr:caspase-3-like [Pantherophis guttatus]
MACPKRNRAVIIVNHQFLQAKGLRPRVGARREADKLFRALSKCNYDVKLFLDLTAKEIEEVYEKESQAEHGKCFVSILSSHGEEGSIMDCQGQALNLTCIYKILSPERCPHLAGKPKIFFIQACRGNRFDDGIYLETDSRAPEEDCFSHYLSIPENTAVMFSCSPGYVSFSNRWESMFLKALLEVLEGEERKLKITKLMTWINWKVAFFCEAKGTEYKGKKEMPCFVTNMVEEVYPFKQDRECSD